MAARCYDAMMILPDDLHHDHNTCHHGLLSFPKPTYPLTMSKLSFIMIQVPTPMLKVPLPMLKVPLLMLQAYFAMFKVPVIMFKDSYANKQMYRGRRVWR